MNKTVFLLLKNMPHGGVERVTIQLIKGLHAEGFRPVLIVCQGDTRLYANDRIEDFAEVMLLRSPGGIKAYTGLALMLRKLVKQRKPRAIISAREFENMLTVFACAGTQTKAVLTRHVPLLEKVNTQGGDTRWYTPWIYRLVNRWAHKIVAVSNGIKDELQAVLPSKKRDIVTIYNPIVDDVLRAKLNEPVNEPWWQADRVNLIAVGRLSTQKGFDLLLQAMALMVSKRSGLQLTICGEGELEEALQSQAKQLGIAKCVQFVGNVENPLKFIRHSAALLLSSRWEGLPTVMIEAAAANTPIVAFDCPTGPKEIFALGVSGELVPNGEVEAFADAVLRSLDRAAAQIDNDVSMFEREYVTRAYVKLFE